LEIEPVVGASCFLVANDRKRHIRRLNSRGVYRKNLTDLRPELGVAL
jgi:hypothetical protein